MYFFTHVTDHLRNIKGLCKMGAQLLTAELKESQGTNSYIYALFTRYNRDPEDFYFR